MLVACGFIRDCCLGDWMPLDLDFWLVWGLLAVGVGWLLRVIVVSLDCAGGCVWNCGFCGSGFVVVVV